MKYICYIIFITIFNTISLSNSLSKEKSFMTLFNDIQNQDNWIEELNTLAVLEQPIYAGKLPSLTHIIPLMRAYPVLQTLPYLSFYDEYTPIQKLELLAKELNIPQLYLKNDGIIKSHYTGNKRRKLEFELARALTHHASAIITFGCVGSNHAVATSEYSLLLGLQTVCFLQPQPSSHVVRKNLLLHCFNNTELHLFSDTDLIKVATLYTWYEYKNRYGTYPYIIPKGASTSLGGIGFVNAAFELKEQINNKLLPEPDYIYIACGGVESAASAAGLLLGCKAAGLQCVIRAIAVEPEIAVNECKNKILKLFNSMNKLLHQIDPTFALYELKIDDIYVDLRFTGSAYGQFTHAGVEAQRLIKDLENITLEGTYTAKTFAALQADAQAHKLDDKIILFWNSYCGNDFKERLATADYKKLPVCFHQYFEEDVQELDRI